MISVETLAVIDPSEEEVVHQVSSVAIDHSEVEAEVASTKASVVTDHIEVEEVPQEVATIDQEEVIDQDSTKTNE